MTTRAVSNPVGVILILGMTILSVGALVAVGGAVIDDTRADAERSQMENSMSAFSSKASLVGLGESGHQRFSLGRVSQGQVDVREDAGNVRIWVDRSDCEDDDCEIANTSMGAVVYENDGREIAYQGGGVWARQDDFSRMLSPPEFHYRAETLTFPIINVTGDGAVSGDVRGTVSSDEEARQLYPNNDLANPLANGTVYVEIESEYCRGWEMFIQERSQGGINKTCDQGPSDTLVVDLDVDLDPTFGTAVTTGGYYPPNGDNNIESYREGVYPSSATETIRSKAANCLEDPCKSFPESGSLGGEIYYTEKMEKFSDLTFDRDTVVVLNDTNDQGLSNVSNIEITGGSNVTVYLHTDQEFEMIGGDKINAGGDPTNFRMFVSSDASIRFNGNIEYVGALYAPGSTLSGGKNKRGGGNINVTGAVVVNTFDFKGNPIFSYDERMEELDPQIEADTIKYLHISENSIRIDF